MNPELRDLTAKWTSYPPEPYTDDPNNLFEIEVVSGNGSVSRVTLTRLQAAEVAQQITAAPVVDTLLYIRCMEHRDIPQYNTKEISGAECAACEIEAAFAALPDYFCRLDGSLAHNITAYREFVNKVNTFDRKTAERADRESKLAVILAQELAKHDGGKFHSSLTFDQTKNEWVAADAAQGEK